MSGQLFAEIMGEGDHTIVLLHGFGGFHGHWTGLQSVLADEARVIAYDLPGHGRSLDYPGAGSAGTAAKAVAADLRARGIERYHLVGHSMGGAIAVLVALRSAGEVASLTLLAPGGFGTEINAPLLERYANAVETDGLQAAMREMAQPGFAIREEHLSRIAEMRKAEGQREMLIRIHGIITKDGQQGEIPREAMAALQMPVVLVWGTADPVLPFSQTTDLPSKFSLRRLDGVGHWLPGEAQDATLEAVRAAVAAAKA